MVGQELTTSSRTHKTRHYKSIELYPSALKLYLCTRKQIQMFSGFRCKQHVMKLVFTLVFESLTMLVTLLMMCFPAGSPTGSMHDAVQ